MTAAREWWSDAARARLALQAMREPMWLRTGGRCEYCGIQMPTWYDAGAPGADVRVAPSIDHRMPKSRGGTDDPENLAIACRSCNSSKGAKTEAEFRAWREASPAARIEVIGELARAGLLRVTRPSAPPAAISAWTVCEEERANWRPVEASSGQDTSEAVRESKLPGRYRETCFTGHEER